MSAPSQKRLRILVLWGASYLEEYLPDFFLDNPKYDFEIVSGDRSSGPSPHAASLGRLWSLRQRLKCGEFDLVISGPIQNSAWPRPKRLGTCLAQAFRYFTYKRGRLDSYWAPWLVSGKVRDKVPLAVFDFLDTPYVLPKDFPLLKAATLYFKVNLFFWRRQSLMPLEIFFGMRRVIAFTSKLRPLTHGIAPRSIPAKARPMRERDIDLCFTGTIVPLKSPDDVNPFVDLTQNPIRQEIYERCEKLKNRYRVFCSHGLVPLEEYRELLQRSKLIVCTESFGCETFRHYGVSGAGAVPLINWPYAQNYNPLQPDVHAIYFSLIGDDFERTVVRALSDPEKLDEIAQNARAFTLKHKMRADIGEMIIEETLREHSKRRV